MKKSYKILNIVLVLTLFFIFIFFHELVHYRIDEMYGLEPKLVFTQKGIGVQVNQTQLEKLDKITLHELYFLQAQTEMIGYHTFAIVIILLALLVRMS